MKLSPPVVRRVNGGPPESEAVREPARLWEDFSFVASSSYRERVIHALAAKPKFPSQLADATDLRLNHVSRSLREMGGRGLVECLNPAAKARGRLYGLTEAGSALLKYLDDSNRRMDQRRTAGARNRTAVSGSTGRGRSLPATPALDPPGVGPGSGHLRCPARPLSYGSVDAAGFGPAIGLRRRIKSPVPWTSWLRVRQ